MSDQLVAAVLIGSVGALLALAGIWLDLRTEKKPAQREDRRSLLDAA
jgi:hypothetical protein